jgi:hypothetical protein
MYRTRRIGALGAAVVLALAISVVGGDAASAAKPVVTAVGVPSCNGAGKIKIDPPVTNSPVAGTRTLTTKLKFGCTGATGNPLVTLSSGKWTSTTTMSASVTCATWDDVISRPSTTVADIKWKGVGGKINPTHLVYSTSGQSPNGLALPGAVLLFDLIPIPDSIPLVTGSYAGELLVVGANAPSATFFSGNPACVKGIKKLAVNATLLDFPD